MHFMFCMHFAISFFSFNYCLIHAVNHFPSFSLFDPLSSLTIIFISNSDAGGDGDPNAFLKS